MRNHVQFAGGQLGGEDMGVVFFEEQQQRRGFGVQRRHQRRENIGRDGEDGAKAQRLGEFVALGLRHVLQQRGFLQHAPRLRHQPFAGGSDQYLVAVAFKQRHVQFVLQLADGDAERRLGDMAGGGGAGEVFHFRQRDEIAQIG